MTDYEENPQVERTNGKAFISFFIGFLIWMIVIAGWFFNYSFPSGEGTLIDFVAIFLRELLILGIGIILAAYIAIKKIKRDNKTK